MTLYPGDVFATRSATFIGRAVRVFAGGTWNHVGMIVCGGTLDEAEVVEAVSKVVRRRLMDAYGRGNVEIAAWRPAIMPEQAAAVVADALSNVGEKYGWWVLLQHLGDWAVSRARGGRSTFLFRRLGGTKYGICVWIVTFPFAKIGWTFSGKAAKEADTDDVTDEMQGHPERWMLVLPRQRLHPLGALEGGE